MTNKKEYSADPYSMDTIVTKDELSNQFLKSSKRNLRTESSLAS